MVNFLSLSCIEVCGSIEYPARHMFGMVVTKE